jgi:putative addiction module killer protein
MKLTIREYLTPEGKSPFREWLDTFALPVRARIQARVFRFELGNLGDHKAIGGGVWEARLAFGPGYRLYFAKQGRTIILLLLGGTKASQAKDIRRARQFWTEYLEARRHGTTQ